MKSVLGGLREAGTGGTGAGDAGATLVTRPQPPGWQLGSRRRCPRGGGMNKPPGASGEAMQPGFPESRKGQVYGRDQGKPLRWPGAGLWMPDKGVLSSHTKGGQLGLRFAYPAVQHLAGLGTVTPLPWSEPWR